MPAQRERRSRRPTRIVALRGPEFDAEMAERGACTDAEIAALLGVTRVLVYKVRNGANPDRPGAATADPGPGFISAVTDLGIEYKAVFESRILQPADPGQAAA